MKNVFALVLSVLLITVMLFGGNTAMAEELATPEELTAAAGMTVEDFDVEALREIIKRFNVTRASIENAPKEEFAEALKKVLASDYMNNYQYLFSAPNAQIQFSDIDADKIKRIAVYATYELVCETAYIDFQDGKVYVDLSGNFLPDISKAEIQKALEAELKQGIVERLKQMPEDLEDDGESSADSDRNSDYGIAVETQNDVKHAVFKNNEQAWDVIHSIIVLCAGDAYTEL